MMRRFLAILLFLAACQQQHVSQPASIDHEEQQWRAQRRSWAARRHLAEHETQIAQQLSFSKVA